MATPVQSPTGQRPPEAAGRRAMLYAFLALVVTFLLPVGGLVLGLIALVIGIRAVGLLRRAGKPATVAIVGVVISSVASFIAVGTTGLQLYFASELSTYTECKIGAGTVAAQSDCVERLERSMEQRVPFLRPGELQFPIAP
ncbi:hypothetical protein Misp01_06350 [Microtetraspora sp. NBRC 13810]|uniref:hypothetical protein n=1 Tax=Microtetraspora sp. NBRC 13810 TaxID=3030990 RepID=UPI0024A114E5|nr:hypothetical protein [Microtetraspora sp. NBRC 13810]GLW05505.1 hypothetical protein Misp01_06350 [Microtetraspora sp. NBRC 13810]